MPTILFRLLGDEMPKTRDQYISVVDLGPQIAEDREFIDSPGGLTMTASENESWRLVVLGVTVALAGCWFLNPARLHLKRPMS